MIASEPKQSIVLQIFKTPRKYAYETGRAALYDQLRFWRTRRKASFGFLRTTIQSMMDVANDKPYLRKWLTLPLKDASRSGTWLDRSSTYQVKIYWAWLFRRLTSAARPTGRPFAIRSYISTNSGTERWSARNR